MTHFGAVSILTFDKSISNALSRSPAPEVDVEALPPCLQTSMPIPAATIAELVETLNVFWPSPPVPTISTNALFWTDSDGIISEYSKTALAAAAIYSEW
ncbi:hypothetical protein WICMUC_003239 [Wickerhamomyces mucosus]|uniref:Uncharacterized protein n=1 Tax=Wickerhamomyces mucosus TaxID=1378264 RepID=A0A9P8PLU6_9ASCO|nr:hypothetical protein WICMUC_003239 [Wickerhamomyces mucosus]